MQEQVVQQSSDLINRLLDEQQQKKSSDLDVFAEKNQVLITTSRVVGIRYRIYFILLLIVVIILGNTFVLPAWDAVQATQNTLDDINVDVSAFETKKAKADADMQLIKNIETQQSTIISCLNERVNCASIDQALRNNFSFARSYIQLNNLTDPKMYINEKIILANINEYLLRDPVTKAKNGVINTIAIGNPQIFTGNLHYVLLRLNITFDTKDALLSFLDNVEKRVLPDENYRVLYKIDKVNYDIAEYTIQQKVDLDLKVYYYTD